MYLWTNGQKKCNVADFEDERGLATKQPQETVKRKDRDSPLELPERNGVLLAL